MSGVEYSFVTTGSAVLAVACFGSVLAPIVNNHEDDRVIFPMFGTSIK